MEGMIPCPACAPRVKPRRRVSPRLVRSPGGFCGQVPSVVYVPVPVYAARQCQQCERSFCIVCGQRASLEENKSTEQINGTVGSTETCKLHQNDIKYASEHHFQGHFSPCFEEEPTHVETVQKCSRCGHNMVDDRNFSDSDSHTGTRNAECSGHQYMANHCIPEDGMSWFTKMHVPYCPHIDPSQLAACGQKGVHHRAHKEGRKNEETIQTCQHSIHVENFEGKAKAAENAQNTADSSKARRLSADSGRITWSDSGESVFSDFQFGDWNHRVTTSGQRAPLSCSPEKEPGASSTAHDRRITGQAEERPNETRGKTQRTPTECTRGTKPLSVPQSYSREERRTSRVLLSPHPAPRPSCERSVSCGSNVSRPLSAPEEDASITRCRSEKQPGLIFSFRIPNKGEYVKSSNSGGCEKLIRRQQNPDKTPPESTGLKKSQQYCATFAHGCTSIPLPEDAPRRSRSDILPMPSSRFKSATLGASPDRRGRFRSPTGESAMKQHLSLVEVPDPSSPAIPPTTLRSRSRSLFVLSNTERTKWMEAHKLPTIQPERPATLFETEKPDFTEWTNLVNIREIHGDIGNKEGIKAYGITALPSQRGIAVTDADKVKIKIYDIGGELKHSFGTPTWPRYGRGITATTDGRVAVCHLTEVCVYSTEGKLITRYQKDEFNSCWGIACDMKGNLVVTDPKSSSVFILNGDGDIVKCIGRRISTGARSKSNSCKTVHKSTSWKNNLGIKAFRPTRKLAQTEQSKNTLSDSIRRMSNVSLPPMQATGEQTRLQSRRNVRLLAPRYVAVNSKNQILVTDTKQRCLLVFEPNGRLLFSIGGGRIGCKECSKGRRAGAGRKSSTEFVDVAERASLPEMSPCAEIVERRPSWTKTPKEKSHHLLTDICSQEICSAKQQRVRVLGTMYRGDMARNESVESEAYHKREMTQGDNGSQRSLSSGSSTVGSRLQHHDSSAQEECSSYIELPFAKKENSIFLRPLSKLTRNLSKRISKSRSPLWVRRQNRKRGENAKGSWSAANGRICAPTGECNSLKSLEEDEVKELEGGSNALCSPIPVPTTSFTGSSPQTIPRSLDVPNSASVSAPRTPESAWSKDKEVKDQSSGNSSKEAFLSPDGSLDSRTAYSFNLNEYSIISSESEWGEHWDEEDDCQTEENEQRTACRRCHVDDPRGICVDENDNILLVDRARNRVSIFTPEGHFVRHILTEEDGLAEPMACCVLHDGSLALIDSSSSIKIYKFSSSDREEC